MSIKYYASTQTFHLFNDQISYLIKIADDGVPVHLYYGAAIPDKENYDYLFELAQRPMATNPQGKDRTYSYEHIKQEYPAGFGGDYRMPAFNLQMPNGSRLNEFVFDSFEIINGKPALKDLPYSHVETEEEATTLILHLKDALAGLQLDLSYSIFENLPAIARSAALSNQSDQTIQIDSLASFNLDLPDAQYNMIELTGAWARERSVKTAPLHEGMQSIYSLRGSSSANFNPFVALKRPETTEGAGEALGFTLVYSGNFLASVDVDTFNTARVQMQIHPHTFSWPLKSGESFQAPEALLVYSNAGLNGMSQTFHTLMQENIARGPWKKKERPILINNWEGTYFNFHEDDLLEMAKEAKELGIELFVLDDGWFLNRNDDTSSLGDWITDPDKLPNGMGALSRKIEEMGLKFGLWFEPEMVNENSLLYKEHPEWVLRTPQRSVSTGRYQLVLDFSNPDVVDYIFESMCKILDDASISYIKWDMNRAMSEVYSNYWPADQQGTIYHRYILGVYDLYARLIERYPNILFESCASGGSRFDAGMLFYAPQAWCSDDTDAVERIKIQYGTSMLYPTSMVGAHVSAVPNHQLVRTTPISTRANVACFGTFGYELDPRALSKEEKEEIKKQIVFMKEYRHLLQYGTFYRLLSPFDGKEAAWIVVSPDKKEAIVAYYRVLQEINQKFRRIRLQGLDENLIYTNSLRNYEQSGAELMRLGLISTDSSSSELNGIADEGDYVSRLFILKAK
jgi:alpha-galactosidase